MGYRFIRIFICRRYIHAVTNCDSREGCGNIFEFIWRKAVGVLSNLHPQIFPEKHKKPETITLIGIFLVMAKI
jgi:hypothetical protein